MQRVWGFSATQSQFLLPFPLARKLVSFSQTLLLLLQKALQTEG
jgi:hypothetical protein